MECELVKVNIQQICELGFALEIEIQNGSNSQKYGCYAIGRKESQIDMTHTVLVHNPMLIYQQSQKE